MFSYRATVQVFLITAGMTLLPTLANADLITNGSFEAGTFVNDGNGTMSLSPGATTITGWTVVTDKVAWIIGANPWGLSAQEGDRFLDLTDYTTGAPFGGVTQDIATIAGQEYDLSFYLGSYTARWGGPPVSISATAGATNGTFTVSTTSTQSTWTPFALHFTATSATTPITLTGAAGSQYIGLDNVSVVQAGGPTPVPEPSSMILLGSVAVGLCLAARRQNRKKQFV